jgi:hypothetical protein
MKLLVAQTGDAMMSLGNPRTDVKACLKEICCVGSGLIVDTWKALLNTVLELGFYYRQQSRRSTCCLHN